MVGGVQPAPTTDGYWPVPSGHTASTQPLGGGNFPFQEKFESFQIQVFCLFVSNTFLGLQVTMLSNELCCCFVCKLLASPL